MCQYKLTSNKFLNEHNFINVREYDKLTYTNRESTNLYILLIYFFSMYNLFTLQNHSCKKILYQTLKIILMSNL